LKFHITSYSNWSFKEKITITERPKDFAYCIVARNSAEVAVLFPANTFVELSQKQ